MALPSPKPMRASPTPVKTAAPIQTRATPSPGVSNTAMFPLRTGSNQSNVELLKQSKSPQPTPSTAKDDNAAARKPVAKLPPLPPEMRAEMIADVDDIVRILKKGPPELSDQLKFLETVRKWSRKEFELSTQERGSHRSPVLDQFLIYLKGKPFKRIKFRNPVVSWFEIEQSAMVYDALWHELGGFCLEEFKRVVKQSETERTDGAENKDFESVGAVIAKQEAMGMWGMLKGMGTGLASMGGPMAAQWVSAQFDETAHIFFGHEWDSSDALFWGMNAAQIGTAGGDVIMQLAMLGRNSPNAVKGKVSLVMSKLDNIKNFHRALGVMGGLQGIFVAAKGIAQVIEDMQQRNQEITPDSLVHNPEFINQTVSLGSSVIGIVLANKGAPAPGKEAVKRAIVGVLLSATQVSTALNELVHIARSDASKAEKELKYGQVISGLIPQLVGLVIAGHGVVDSKREAGQHPQEQSEDQQRQPPPAEDTVTKTATPSLEAATVAPSKKGGSKNPTLVIKKGRVSTLVHQEPEPVVKTPVKQSALEPPTTAPALISEPITIAPHLAAVVEPSAGPRASGLTEPQPALRNKKVTVTYTLSPDPGLEIQFVHHESVIEGAPRKPKGPVDVDNFGITTEQQRALANQPVVWDGAPSSKPAGSAGIPQTELSDSPMPVLHDDLPATRQKKASGPLQLGTSVKPTDIPAADEISFVAAQRQPVDERPQLQLEIHRPEPSNARVPAEPVGVSLSGRTKGPASPPRNVEPTTPSGTAARPAPGAEGPSDASSSRPGVPGLGLYDPAPVVDVVPPASGRSDIQPEAYSESFSLSDLANKRMTIGPGSRPPKARELPPVNQLVAVPSAPALTEKAGTHSATRLPLEEARSNVTEEGAVVEFDTSRPMLGASEEHLEVAPMREGNVPEFDTSRPMLVDLSQPVDVGLMPSGPRLKPSKSKRELAKYGKPFKRIFGEPSEFSSGTNRRIGMHFNERNAAETMYGLKTDYNTTAGRPNGVKYRVDAGTSERVVQTDRAFTRHQATEGAQATTDDYTNTGWDRGHLAQREAFKGNTDAELVADQMPNIVPMHPNLNRGEGSLWRAAEVETIRLADEHGSVMVEVTPIYDANPPRLPNGTPIPKEINRKVIAPDGKVLLDTRYPNK